MPSLRLELLVHWRLSEGRIRALVPVTDRSQRLRLVMWLTCFTHTYSAGHIGDTQGRNNLARNLYKVCLLRSVLEMGPCSPRPQEDL